MYPIFKKIKRSITEFIRDIKEDAYRKFPGPLAGLPHQGLIETQLYPNGNNFFDGVAKGTLRGFGKLECDANTKMASIGTCFAEEFSLYLKENPNVGTYLNAETNVFNASANWGRVYTIKNLRQIVDYSLQESFPVFIESTKKGYIDPLREHSIGAFRSEDDASYAIEKHRQLSKKVLHDADLIVITLGQNETWYDTQLDIYWGAAPPLDLRHSFPERFIPAEFTFAENKNDLNYVINQIKLFNSKVKFVFTISPVGAYATFLDKEIVTQSFAGKCNLRSVVHEAINEYKDFTFYYPSFELVLCDNPSSFNADNRHVKRKKVKQIFKLLGSVLKG